jgi:signal transduction histidine kinase
LIGKTDADFNANSAEVACFRRQDLEVIDSLQERFIAEEVMTDVTGTQRWLQTVKRPIVNGEGVATMVLAASTDITERKRMEEALRQRELDLRHAIEERERISQDLHDGILQSLYAVGLGLESCKPLIKQRKHKQAFTTLEQAVGQLNHVMREVRNFIAGLESEVLQGGNFETALRTVINAATQAYPVECRIHIEPEALPYIPLDRGLQLLNIVREALSNIVRHAGASQMSVSVRRLRRTIRIRIHDNGVGFDLQTAAGTGHGLLNMAARAKKIGTDFELHSAPGEGTTIIVDLPKEEGYAEREGETHSSVARGRP